jgi:hypothetical protein
MTSISEIIDDVLGRGFTIECSNIVLRGRDDSAGTYFSGPGVISGNIAGPFTITVHNSLKRDPGKFIELENEVGRGLMMCFDAIDYHDCKWTGGWLSPIIQGPSSGRCLIMGNFSQLAANLPLTGFDEFRNSTVNYYVGDLRLPMLEMANIQRTRGEEVEHRSTHWDRTKLNFDGASVVIQEDEAESRTIVSTEHIEGWDPPYCEVGLADAIGFVCATPVRPRITGRYLDTGLLFVRETPSSSQSKLPRPIAYQGPRNQDFWNLFLAFLRDCKARKESEGTPLARLFSELVYASTGTIHVLVLSLVVAVDDLVAQIVGKPQPTPGFNDLKNYVEQWSGDADLKESAIGVLQSMLSRTSTLRHLKELATKGIVTADQIQIWKDLRPKLAHGKIADYNEDLWHKRNQLIGMVYRLAARILGYKGALTDYTQSPLSNLISIGIDDFAGLLWS